jgi:hypothetical protein
MRCIKSSCYLIFAHKKVGRALKIRAVLRFWVVDVYKEGLYEISVRRWPEEVNIPIYEAPEKGGRL